jgi:hypothetical protein
MVTLVALEIHTFVFYELDQVILEVPPNPRNISDHRDIIFVEYRRFSNTGELKDLRRMNGTGG